MQALVKIAPGPDQVALRDWPVPTPSAEEVLVRVRAAAVCGSDVHIWHDRFPSTPPLVIGHEFCGVIEQVGAKVTGFGVGDVVVAENNPEACGRCRVCVTGFPNLCPQKRAIGFKRDGCFAEYVTVPAELLHRVPAGVPVAAAALSEPLAVAVHAVEDRCGIAPGDVVVVLGPGAIGLLAAQVARAAGAAQVIVAGTDQDESQRLACARQLDLATANVQRENLDDRVRTLTGGLGADVVVEAAGAVPAIRLAARLLRRAGRLAVVGLTGRPEVPVDWDGMVSKALRVEFSYSSRRRNWDLAMNYLARGAVQTLPLVTGRAMLADWETVFRTMERGETIRTVFEWEEAK